MKQIVLLSAFFFGSLVFLQAQLPWPAESPAPDGYGYTWKTNDATGGPTFSWVDITTMGTKVDGLADDNFVGPFDMGIDFPFYWLTKNELWISSNGYLSFAPFNISSQSFGFPAPPRADGDDDLIAPYMTDLSAAGTGNPAEVYYYHDAANNRFIVSWINIPYWTNNAAGFAGSNSFQAILNEADSTITFQYLNMSGDWNSSYNNVSDPFVVGIEAITGNIGLSVPQPPVNAANKPVDSTAITFYAPSSPGPVIDAAVTVVENKDRAGFFVPWEPPPASTNPEYRLSAEVTNLGSAPITSTIMVKAQAQDTTGQIFYLKLDSIPGGLAAGASQGFFFEGAFYPPLKGPYQYQVEITNPTDIGDVNPANDFSEAEAVVIDTTQEEIILSYISDNINNSLATGVTPISWSGNNGNSGAGVFFDPFGYPVKIVAIEYRPLFSSAGPISNGFIAEIHGVDTVNNSLPGPLLFTRTLPVDSVVGTGDWTRVNLDSAITIDSDGFYVSWLQQDSNMFLATEAVPPISRRSYEILDGAWSIYRDNSEQDIWIRAVINIEDAIFTDIEDPLSALTRFEAFPNPTTGPVKLKLSFSKPTDVMIKVLDLQGRKHLIETKRNVNQWEESLDISQLSPGIYLLQLITPEGQQSKRIIKN